MNCTGHCTRPTGAHITFSCTVKGGVLHCLSYERIPRGSGQALPWPCASYYRHSDPLHPLQTAFARPPSSPTGVITSQDKHHGRALQWSLAQHARKWPALPPAAHRGRGNSLLAFHLDNTLLAGSVPQPHRDATAALLSHLLPFGMLTASRHHSLPLRRAPNAALHPHTGTAAGREEGCEYLEQRDHRPVHCCASEQHPTPASGIVGPRGASRIVSCFPNGVQISKLTKQQLQIDTGTRHALARQSHQAIKWHKLESHASTKSLCGFVAQGHRSRLLP